MDEIETLREELKLTQQALFLATQVNRYKTGFLGLISHELRSHLSSLLSLHQLIIGDLCENDQEEREFINQAYIAGRNLMKVIEDVATVSKLEYGSISLNIEPLSPAEFFQDLHHLIYLPIRNKQIQLEMIFPDDGERILYADSKRLLTAMVIFIETAINHIHTGAIRIALAGDEGEATVIVMTLPATGQDWFAQTAFPGLNPGFSREELHRFAGEVGLSPGLKLELVKNILATMSGRLDIVPDETSISIKFLLPLQRESLPVG